MNNIYINKYIFPFFPNGHPVDLALSFLLCIDASLCPKYIYIYLFVLFLFWISLFLVMYVLQVYSSSRVSWLFCTEFIIILRGLTS